MEFIIYGVGVLLMIGFFGWLEGLGVDDTDGDEPYLGRY